MFLLLLVIRVARYLAVLAAFYGAVALWFEADGNLFLRIVGGIGLCVAGIVVALVLAIWSGKLAAEYAPNDKRLRGVLITGKMGPPRSPHDR